MVGDGIDQAARTVAWRSSRDARAVDAALGRLARETADGANVMPPLLGAARVGATVGEMADVLRALFGEFEEPALW